MGLMHEGFISSVSQATLTEFFKSKVFRNEDGYYVVGVAFASSSKKCTVGMDSRMYKCAFVAMHRPEDKRFEQSEGVFAEIVRYYTRWEARGRYYICVEPLPEEWILYLSDAETNCPEWFLRLLTPTDEEHALKWRAACRANA